METRPPQVAVEVEVIPDAGKRPVPLRFRSRAEVRDHVAAITAAYELLPDDGLDLNGVVDAEIVDVSWSLAELVEAIASMNQSQLRHVIGDAHEHAPFAVENAIILAGRKDDTWTKGDDGSIAGDKAAPHCSADWQARPHALWHCSLDAGHDGPHTAWSGARRCAVWDDGNGIEYPDDLLPADKPECGEAWPVDPSLTCFREPGHYGKHAAAPEGERQTRVWANAADDDLGDDPDTAAGELAVDEVLDARDRERRSDSAVTGGDEPAEGAVIVSCPESLKAAGPCSRLAGHHGLHRTLAGHEWGSPADPEHRPLLPVAEAHDPDGDRDEPLLPVSFLPLSHEYLMGHPASAGATA